MRAHIAGFGGDPDNVTVFGQSAGGWSVIDLVKSPRAAGLFAGAIVHSGGAGNVVARETAAAQAGERSHSLNHLHVRLIIARRI